MLSQSFGNVRLLLQNKLRNLDRIGDLWKAKGDKRIANGLASLINAMRDLQTLTCGHNIEGQLYEGGGLEKVISTLGDFRHKKV